MTTEINITGVKIEGRFVVDAPEPSAQDLERMQRSLDELIKADFARWFAPVPLTGTLPLPRCKCRGILHDPACSLALT